MGDVGEVVWRDGFRHHDMTLFTPRKAIKRKETKVVPKEKARKSPEKKETRKDRAKMQRK